MKQLVKIFCPLASAFAVVAGGALGAGTALGAGSATAAASAAAAKPSCRIPAGHVIAGGKIARLIAVPTPQGSAALFACIRRTGRKIPLDDAYSDARVSGRWVAWQRAGRPGHWRIAVHDLRSGKERLVDGHVAGRSLRLTTRGTIVWVQQFDSDPGMPLYVNDAVNGGRLLDGDDVDPTSVRLAGRRVAWVSGGERHSAVVR